MLKPALPLFAILSLFFSSPHFAQNALAAQNRTTPPAELKIHQLGMLIGYANYCIKLAGEKDHKDTEGMLFGLHYAKPYKYLGQKAVALFQGGVKKGVFSAVSDSGAKCASNLQKLIKMYRDIGLQGKLYKRTLAKLRKGQPSPPSGHKF